MKIAIPSVIMGEDNGIIYAQFLAHCRFPTKGADGSHYSPNLPDILHGAWHTIFVKYICLIVPGIQEDHGDKACESWASR